MYDDLYVNGSNNKVPRRKHKRSFLGPWGNYIFSSRTSILLAPKHKINKLDFIKIKKTFIKMYLRG